MVFYGILDLLAKPVFAFVHLFSLRKIDYSSLHLTSGKYTEFEGTTVKADRNGENTSDDGTAHHGSTPDQVEKAQEPVHAAPAS